tara:strand:+ start:1757 stop:2602 length:846 start_codon:yes stop_codon:yes gene_type:complete
MSELIIRKIIHNVGKSSQIIIDNFEKLIQSNDSIYSIIQSIPNDKIIIYGFILILVVFFITKIDIKLNLLFACFVAVMIINYMISRDNVLQKDFIDTKDTQLKFLNNLLFYDDDKYITSVINDNFNIEPPFEQSYLYLNPLIVEFFYNTRENSQYNLSNYINSLKCINAMLGLNYQLNMKLENPYQNYDNMKKLYKEALNNYHSIIYSLPSNKIVYHKFNNSLKILQSLLIKHIEDAKTICKMKNSKEDNNINTLPDTILEDDVGANDMNIKGFSENYSFF